MQPEHIPQFISSTVSRFTILKHIGSGSNADVFIGVNNETLEKVAIKIPTNSCFASFKREANTLKPLTHENIISFKEYQESISVKRLNEKISKVSILVTEFAPKGDLFEYVQHQEQSMLPEALARTYFQQIISALAYLHKSEVAHRDVKLENLILDENFGVKLVDFGFAEKIIPNKKSLHLVGTEDYFTPEMHDKMPHCSQSADLFAAGIALFIMICGYMPFAQARSTDKAYRLLIRQETDKFWRFHEKCMRQKDPNWKFQKSLKDLLTKIWALELDDRYTLEDVQSHEWMSGDVWDRDHVKAFGNKNE